MNELEVQGKRLGDLSFDAMSPEARKVVERWGDAVEQLTPKQAEAYKVLCWLLSPIGRQEGRSHVIMLALLTSLIVHGQTPLFDHWPGHDALRVSVLRPLMAFLAPIRNMVRLSPNASSPNAAYLRGE